jgi:peptide/nickel transport system substrate-binding protein
MHLGATLGKSIAKLRINPRRAWYNNVEEVVADGDTEAIFVLKRPQPALVALLASGFAPIYPCHVPPAEMRQHPIGTGPFKFVEFKPNEAIKLVRNPDYWKPGRPYLDGIEYTIIPNRSTAILAFVAGKFDLTWPYDVAIPLLKEVEAQVPRAECTVASLNASRNLDINGAVPPFDKPEIRRAMALSLDRKAFIDILAEGVGSVGGAMLPPPEGVWGLTPEMLQELPGYGPDIEKNRAEARAIMEKFGYGPDHRLKVKVSARNIAIARDPAVILIDQLKTIYIDGELDLVDSAVCFPSSRAATMRWLSASAPVPSTIPISNSTRTTPAVPSSMSLDTATARSRHCSAASRWKPISKNASSWCGRSTSGCSKMMPGRSSITTPPRLVGSPTSKD